MITKHDDLLGTLIHDVAHLLRHEIDKRLQRHNLTRVKWLALGIVSNRPLLTQAELAAEMELGNAAVGRLIDRLVERGFVVRQEDPNDRRAYRLVITNEARTLLERLDETASHIRRDLLEGIGREQITQMNAGLSKLKNNLKHCAVVAWASTVIAVQKLDSEVYASVGAII